MNCEVSVYFIYGNQQNGELNFCSTEVMEQKHPFPIKMERKGRKVISNQPIKLTVTMKVSRETH